MAQRSRGVWSLLTSGTIYNLLQWGVGGGKERRRYIQEFVCPEPQATILDVGCGPGNLVPYLPHTIQYYGVDLSEQYIQHARRRYGHRASFICSSADDERWLERLPKCDLVLAHGLLHHLDDSQVLKLLELARRAMHSQGRFISIDNCYIDNQSKIARFFIRHDRGLNVRTVLGYEALTKQVFQHVKTTLKHDMLHVPYTHIIMECS